MKDVITNGMAHLGDGELNFRCVDLRLKEMMYGTWSVF